MSNALEAVIWSADTPKRKFLYVDDAVAAPIFVMQLDKTNYDSQIESMHSHLNVGSGSDVTINEVAQAMAHATGDQGNSIT